MSNSNEFVMPITHPIINQATFCNGTTALRAAINEAMNGMSLGELQRLLDFARILVAKRAA